MFRLQSRRHEEYYTHLLSVCIILATCTRTNGNLQMDAKKLRHLSNSSINGTVKHDIIKSLLLTVKSHNNHHSFVSLAHKNELLIVNLQDLHS